MNSIELPERAHSTSPVKVTELGTIETLQWVARSAPAFSIRSGGSNRTIIARPKLELELKHLKEKQKLDQEQRELQLEMHRWEMEQKKLAELEEWRRLHELEISACAIMKKPQEKQ